LAVWEGNEISEKKKIDHLYNQKVMSRCENCIVRKFNTLRAMNKEELNRVSDSKTTRSLKKGEIIFGEGEKLNGVYCVKDGVAKLSKLSANGRDQIVKLATKGQILGQRSVIAEEKVNLTAVAVSDMEVCFIPKDSIVDTLRTNPSFILEVLRHMAHDLKEADDVIVNMSQNSVKQRMAAAFFYLRNTYGEDKNGFLNLVLSREDISNIVGTATESAIRIISEFKKKGLIKSSGKKIGISDEKGLMGIVQEFP